MTFMTSLNPNPETHPQFFEDVPSKRLMAWVIDSIIVFGITFLLAILTFGIGFFVFLGIMSIVGVAYRVITLANASATWGMRLAAIEFRDAHGERFGLLLAVLHTLGFYLSFSTFIIQIVSMVLMVTTERKQGLTDMLLGTIAINKSTRRL